MRDFFRKYLSVSKPHSKDASTRCAGGESSDIKSRRQPVFDPRKDDSAGTIHCKIVVQDGGRLLLTELNSKEATFVNGKKIPAKTPLSIAGGDEIEFRKAGVKISFELAPGFQTQEAVASLGGHAALKEFKADTGIVLSDLVIDPSLHRVAATREEIKRPDIGKTFKRAATQAEVNSREIFSSNVAEARRIFGDFFSNGVFRPYYARVFFMVLGVVLSGGYLWTQLNFIPEKFETKTAKNSNNSMPLIKEETKKYDSFDTVLSAAESKPETVEFAKENQPAIDKNLIPPGPDAKQLVSDSQSAEIEKPTIKRRFAVKNKKKNKYKASSESSDPHIDAWAKEFFTN